METADIKVLRLYRPYEPTINITCENGCLCFYDDGEFMALLCKPHLAEYTVVEVHESVVKDTDPMSTPFSCEEEQDHYIALFDLTIRYENFVTYSPQREAIAVERFNALFDFFAEKGGAI